MTVGVVAQKYSLRFAGKFFSPFGLRDSHTYTHAQDKYANLSVNKRLFYAIDPNVRACARTIVAGLCR